MVGRPQKRRVQRRQTGNRQRCWIWGRHLVLETLTARRWPVEELWFAEELPPSEVPGLQELARAAGVLKIVPAPRSSLARWCPKEDHQGYVARMAPFPYAALEEGLAALKVPAFALVLDCIQDPFNFGAILRSADVFGVDAIFVGTDHQCDVTPHVARASAGAVNRVTLCKTDLAALVQTLRRQGVQVLGASEKARATLAVTDFCQPTALVIGNEGRGLRSEILDACTSLIRIPQHGHLNSLNAAAAAAVLLYETRRQRAGG